MRKIVFLLGLLATGFTTGCATYSEADRIARLNEDHRIWPPVVAGQAFPVQTMIR